MNEEKKYHIALSKDMIQGAKYVLLPGNPQRVESIAKVLDENAKQLANNREYTTYMADFHGEKVLVTSTGIGCPSTSIAVEELAAIGLQYFIRVGTCGSIQPHINLGDLVISKAAVRLDGASRHYAPVEYPAVASLSLTQSLLQAAEELEIPHHVGITISSDTFYPGQERYDSFLGYVPRHFQGSVAEWRTLKASNFEMEASTLFVMASTFGLNAACICGVIAKRVESEQVDPGCFETVGIRWQQTVKKALYLDMVKRGFIKK